MFRLFAVALTALSAVQSTFAAPLPQEADTASFWRQPTVFIAGDSTAATFPEDSTKWGWGQSVQPYIRYTVDNHAVSGTSTRSFVREGYWQGLIDKVKRGDYVIIEFGHNDSKTDDRAPLPGTGDETEEVVTNGVTETVRTYPGYLRFFVGEVRARGATPIIFNRVTRIGAYQSWDGVWESTAPPNAVIGAGERDVYVDYALDTAKELGVKWVDQHAVTQKYWGKLGYDVTKTFFIDGTHTTPAGSVKLAEAIIVGMIQKRDLTLLSLLTIKGLLLAF